jgi:hypothetical protein
MLLMEALLAAVQARYPNAKADIRSGNRIVMWNKIEYSGISLPVGTVVPAGATVCAFDLVAVPVTVETV